MSLEIVQNIFIPTQSFLALKNQDTAIYVGRGNENLTEKCISASLGLLSPKQLIANCGFNTTNQSKIYFQLSNPRNYENISEMLQGECVEDCPLAIRTLEINCAQPRSTITVYDAKTISEWMIN